LGRWERGENEVQGFAIIDLADAFGTTPRAILEAAGAVRVSKPKPAIPRRLDSLWIPGFSYAAAGEGVETDDMEYPKGGAEFYVERLPGNRDPDSFSLRARGESMQPFVPPGWAVVVDTRGTPAANDLVVAKIAREGGGYQVVVKRYRGRERRDGRVVIVLESANAYSADIVVPPDRILEIWPVLYTVAPRGQREPHAIDAAGGSDE
jgi:phage repressor protein C with HTH and peptisase S24 domain